MRLRSLWSPMVKSMVIRLALALSLMLPTAASAVSGFLNTHAAVTSISGATLTVPLTTGFAAGDRVLIVQMQGATVDTSNTASHGTIAAYGSAGTYEYATIASVGTGTITLTSALTTGFNTSGAVQIVRVATYTDVTVDGQVSTVSWNGSTGGVIAIDATGTLTLSANINANSRGFRGGARSVTGTFDCAQSSTNYTGVVTGRFGNKGEGIIANNSANAAYRGKRANGGGGGNAMDAGGGGGGNYGSGGNGGREDSQCNNARGGLGGAALSYTGLNRLFMGGGSGSGGEAGETAIGGGSLGGGLIFIRAGTLAGNGGSILASGSAGSGAVGNGAGGGAAGGAIAIRAGAVSGTITVSANGGSGGGDAGSTNARGPGGGGGGGVIAVAGIGCAQLNWSANGGAAGVSVEGLNRGEINWGATAGTAGACLANFAIPAISAAAPDLSISKSSAVFLPASTNDFYVPDNFVEYTITVTNNGSGSADSGSMVLTENLPTALTFFNGDHDGAGNPIQVVAAGGITCCTTPNVSFQDNLGTPLAPQPGYGASGNDPSIRRIVITPAGALIPGGTFMLRFRARIN